MENMEEPSPKKIKRSFVKKSSIPEELISCHNKERIHFDEIQLCGLKPPMKIFMGSKLVYPSILLTSVTLTKNHNLFWEKCGSNFKELIIIRCGFSSLNLILILKNLPNLTKLVILESQSLLSELFIDIEKENSDFFESVSKIESFHIDQSWNGLGSANLTKWLSKMPKITEFEISMVDEDLFIVNCLKLWENQLTSLRLKNKICLETRNQIYQTNISKLKVFQIEGFDEDNGNSLVEFISKQKDLTELSIGICGVDENLLERIGNVVDGLKVLSIYNTENIIAIRNKNVLGLFGQVNKLYISVQSYASLDNFLYLPNDNLTHLVYDQAIEEDDDRVNNRYYDIPFNDMTQFKNLIYFEVSDDYICNFDIQFILKHLPGLEVLKIKTKHTLSDFAFSGGKGEQYPKQEIHDSSYRKWKGTFCTLSRLKSLNELDIESSDNRFTDLALERISKLKKLKIINLSNYKGITIAGIAVMIASCLKLQQITITGCNKKISKDISTLLKNRSIKVIH